jgi:hypothetical protein
VDVWSSKVHSCIAFDGPRVLVPRASLYGGQEAIEAALRPLRSYGVPPRPVALPRLEGADNKYAGLFGMKQFEHAAREDDEAAWIGEFSQADLDFVNARLRDDDLAAFGLRKTLRAPGGGGALRGDGDFVQEIHPGLRTWTIRMPMKPLRVFEGHCGVVMQRGCGSSKNKGSWALLVNETSNWVSALAACAERCRSCPQCTHVSFSREHKDCSWYSGCDVSQLEQQPHGFRTARIS